ncbi:MAG: type II toxin-antitoxin system VapC family toxin [Thaumarchaeota archaeon]|nr:type II toxin-antitoxin system VapC family toxin [Nitrososphaerota archaeon]
MERPAALVVDASVVVKWFVKEADSEDAVRLRDAHTDEELSLFAPDLLVYELANALRYRSGLGDGELEASVRALFDLDVALIAPTAASVSRAASLAREMDVTTYDSAYLALAQDIGSELVTCDKVFHDKVVAKVGRGTKVFMLKDYLAREKDGDKDSKQE